MMRMHEFLVLIESTGYIKWTWEGDKDRYILIIWFFEILDFDSEMY